MESVFVVGGDPLWMSTVPWDTKNAMAVWDEFSHRIGRLFNLSILS